MVDIYIQLFQNMIDWHCPVQINPINQTWLAGVGSQTKALISATQRERRREEEKEGERGDRSFGIAETLCQGEATRFV